MSTTKCPKCDQEFKIQVNLKYRYPRPGFKFSEFKTDFKSAMKRLQPPSACEMIHNQDLVVCPSCGIEYKESERKYVSRFKLISFYFTAIIMFSLFIFGPLIFISILIFAIYH